MHGCSVLASALAAGSDDSLSAEPQAKFLRGLATGLEHLFFLGGGIINRI